MDFTFFVDFFDYVGTFFTSITDFITDGIYSFFREAFVFATKVFIWSYLQSMIFVAEIGYSVYSSIIDDLGVSQLVRSTYGQLPLYVRQGLEFFRVPEGLTMIFSAMGTRFTMRFIPFIGK